MALAAAVPFLAALPHLPDTLPIVVLMQSLPVLAYALAWVVCLALAALLWRAARWPVLAALATAVLLGGRALMPSAVADAPAAFTVATFNTDFWDQHGETEGLEAAFAAIDADVLLLQEHFYLDPPDVFEPIDRAHLLVSCCDYPHVFVDGDLVVASRFPGVDHSHPDPNVQRLTLEIEGRAVEVVNVHNPVHVTLYDSILTEAFWDFARDAAAARSLVYEAVDEALADARASERSALVGGDFNATAMMPSLRRSVLGPLGRDPLAHLDGSFPVGLPLWRIDHVVSTPDLPIACASMPATPVSDHRPVRCTVTRAASGA
ncbi:endonuclease/exonuclease/phosphatase family protein [Salinarimonas ramus]|uniref:endonuclease/exonuclease/phosphatase family protein n=1 Tax=Salinarimonas ramus TaxID=690164 RepID=UPI001665D269|nr:endonuclease/exonuclease/phosphatase family protein [Salinarimonas ramus]